MTTIHFHYTDSYNNPSRGSLAFMPHRRHAANETEILPKPVTIPLLNGEATVNLQPNSSSWVWIVTEYFEGVSKSFYTSIPDRDGVLEHTELVHINPSSLPAPYDAVEPAWWAEVRQYKQTVTDTLLQSEEALTEAKQAIEVGSQSIEQTQHNASLAKAYANESRESSYESRDYRDEAEQWRNEAKEQADRAASGPESAAQRAEDAADSASNSEAAARGFRDEARDSASDARSSETSASGSASTATERASDARNEANRAESEANRAQGYADELMAGPRDYVEQAEAAATTAQGYRDEAASFRDTAQTAVTTAQQHADDAAGYADTSMTMHQQTETIYNTFQSDIDSQYSDWLTPTNRNAVTTHSSYPLKYRYTPMGVQVNGAIGVTNVEDTGALVQFEIPDDKAVRPTVFDLVPFPYTNSNLRVRFSDNLLSLLAKGDVAATSTAYVNIIVPWDE